MEHPTEEQPSETLTPDTENATYFKPHESNDPERFRRLRLYNRNTWKDRREENKEVTHRADNLAILDSLSGQLSLTDYQKQEARRIFDNLNLQTIGKSANLIAFGVCTVVVNDDVPDESRYWPTANDTDQEFEIVADDLDLRENQILSAIGIVQNRRGA